MNNGYIVASAYARALFGQNRAEKQLLQYYDALNILKEAWTKDSFRLLVLNKSVDRKKIGEIVTSLIKQYSDPRLEKFCLLLIQNNILGSIAAIAKAYKSLLQKHNNEVEVIAEYAIQPGNEIQKQHEQFLCSKLNKKVKVEIILNPALLAGVKFTVGDMVIDSSLQARINQLATGLIG